MATLQTLKTYYGHVLRVDYSAIPSTDATMLASLAAQVDAGTTSLSLAVAAVERLAVSTTSVATLAYQFFTGSIPFDHGIDYLVSPQGPNPNNLNSAYYQNFNLENRYINFAINLGKAGEGQAFFTQGYGALDISGAVAKAYAAIFGITPTTNKVAGLVGDLVPDGLGGTETRAQYFAGYGGDGPNGTATKAAAIGWLLAEAAKADTGPYAQANDAFLADLGPDGLARFHSDIVSTYGPPPTYPAGAVINVGPAQSVSTTQSDPALRSTDASDTISASSGLAGTVSAGDGNDLVTVSGGALSGYVDGGPGNDTITTGVLAAAVQVLGGAPNGEIAGGAGNDVINVTQNLANGAIIDGGPGDDTASVVLADQLYNSSTQIIHVEHLVIAGDQIAFGGFDVGAIAPDVLDVFSTANSQVILNNVPDGVVVGLRNVTSGDLSVTFHVDLVTSRFSSVQVGAHTANLHLDNVNLTSTPNASPPPLMVHGLSGRLHLHVDSDSRVGAVQVFEVDLNYATVTIDGLGRLTAGFSNNTVNRLDASAAAAVNLTWIGDNNESNAVVLSSGDDRISVDLLRGSAIESFTLGSGADTFSLYEDGTNAPRFGNLHVSNGAVDGYAVITDFAPGVDHLDLGPTIGNVVTGLSPAAVGQPSLEQALIQVSAQTAPNQTAVFEYSGDTYIYHQDATIGVNTGDGLIKLMGVTGLSIGTGANVADIHYG
jgi:hypothetical protein